MVWEQETTLGTQYVNRYTTQSTVSIKRCPLMIKLVKFASSHYHLRNIGKIGKHLDESSTETLIHAFVTSELDYCNALLNGLPKYQI